MLSADGFLALLRAHGVERLVDVRRRPRSARHPHFDAAPLAAALEREGIAYRHAPDLGGMRSAREDSSNLGIADPTMRAYADHMQTPTFAAALEGLIAEARRARCAIMCAEADPARCHRSFIADALTARGIAVAHIRDAGSAQPHALRTGALVRDGRVRYPGAPGLFDPA